MTEPTWAQRHVPADRLPGDRLLRGAEAAKDGPEEPRRGRSRAPRDVREARHPARGARDRSPASRSTPSSTASRSRRRSRRSSRELGIIFCSFSEAVHEHPELVRKYLGSVVPYTRQLLRGAELGGLLATARSATSRRACAARWSSRPTSASTRRTPGQFERTLIVADEGAYVSYLEGCTAPMRDENQLHAAVVELVALDDAHDQVLDGAELVSRRRGGQGRHLQLRHQARQVRGRELEDLVDAGRDRLGDHLEVPELHPAGRRLGRRVLLGRARRTTTSRPTPARR